MAEVVVRSLQGLTQSLEVGEHRLLSDEAVDAGERTAEAHTGSARRRRNTQHEVIVEQRVLPGD